MGIYSHTITSTLRRETGGSEALLGAVCPRVARSHCQVAADSGGEEGLERKARANEVQAEGAVCDETERVHAERDGGDKEIGLPGDPLGFDG